MSYAVWMISNSEGIEGTDPGSLPPAIWNGWSTRRHFVTRVTMPGCPNTHCFLHVEGFSKNNRLMVCWSDFRVFIINELSQWRTVYLNLNLKIGGILTCNPRVPRLCNGERLFVASGSWTHVVMVHSLRPFWMTPALLDKIFNVTLDS